LAYTLVRNAISLQVLLETIHSLFSSFRMRGGKKAFATVIFHMQSFIKGSSILYRVFVGCTAKLSCSMQLHLKKLY